MGEYRFSEATDTAIVKFLCDLAMTLNLKNWTLGLSPAPPSSDDETDGKDALAEVEPVPHRHMAVVRVCDDFLRIGHKEMLMALIHELCHLYMIGIKQTVNDQDSIRSMSIAELNQFIVRMHHEEEMAVDLMANAWSDIMWEWDSVQKALKKITTQVERTAD